MNVYNLKTVWNFINKYRHLASLDAKCLYLFMKFLTTIKPTIDIPNIIVKQIAGFVVRRITTVIENIPKEGLPVKPANKLGMIKLGSRVDLELPSNDFILLVKENQKVYGPYTKIGYYKTKLTLGKNEVNLR